MKRVSSFLILDLFCSVLSAQVVLVPEKEIIAIVDAMNRRPLDLSVGPASFPRWHLGFTLLTLTDDSDCPYLYINEIPFTFRQIDAEIETKTYGDQQTPSIKVKYGMFPFLDGDAERKTTLPEQLVANMDYMKSPAITKPASAMDIKVLREFEVSKEMMMGFSGGLGGFSIAFFIGSALTEGTSSQNLITTGGIVCAVGAVGSVLLFNYLSDNYNKKLAPAYRKIAERMLE